MNEEKIRVERYIGSQKQLDKQNRRKERGRKRPTEREKEKGRKREKERNRNRQTKREIVKKLNFFLPI